MSYAPVAHAGLFSMISGLLTTKSEAMVTDTGLNSQNMPLLKSAFNSNLALADEKGNATIVNGSAISVETGPLGTLDKADEEQTSHQISLYTVHEGDTLSQIAKMFDVSVNTIIWANDLNSHTVHEGQTLVILPVSGVLHTIKKGDTIKSIAAKYKADAQEISKYNDLADDSSLTVGETITIPDAEISIPVSNNNSKIPAYERLHGANGPYYPGYYVFPVPGGVKTQGLHGYNAIDIGASVGTPVHAAAEGTVIVSVMDGWHGGYGNYVVISHPNGTQTLYAHLYKTLVSTGDAVSQNQLIGLVGSTGRSTGPHTHFEIRGAKNPF